MPALPLLDVSNSITPAGILMRGGTPKGLYLARDALPEDPALRDDLLLGLIGPRMTGR